MKYFLFAWEDHEIRGGVGNFVGVFDSIYAAQDADRPHADRVQIAAFDGVKFYAVLTWESEATGWFCATCDSETSGICAECGNPICMTCYRRYEWRDISTICWECKNEHDQEWLASLLAEREQRSLNDQMIDMLRTEAKRRESKKQ